MSRQSLFCELATVLTGLAVAVATASVEAAVLKIGVRYSEVNRNTLEWDYTAAFTDVNADPQRSPQQPLATVVPPLVKAGPFHDLAFDGGRSLYAFTATSASGVPSLMRLDVDSTLPQFVSVAALPSGVYYDSNLAYNPLTKSIFLFNKSIEISAVELHAATGQVLSRSSLPTFAVDFAFDHLGRLWALDNFFGDLTGLEGPYLYRVNSQTRQIEEQILLPGRRFEYNSRDQLTIDPAGNIFILRYDHVSFDYQTQQSSVGPLLFVPAGSDQVQIIAHDLTGVGWSQVSGLVAIPEPAAVSLLTLPALLATRRRIRHHAHL